MNYPTEEKWKEKFRNEDFYRIMNDNAPITDMISYIEDLIHQRQEALLDMIEEMEETENLQQMSKEGARARFKNKILSDLKLRITNPTE